MSAVATVAPITKPGVYQLTTEEYWAAVPGGSLSSTGARKLIEPAGPARYRYAVDRPREDVSDTFDFGKAAHQLILGDPDDRLVIVNADSWVTKAAREQRDNARLAGLTPILAKQWEVVQWMAAAIQANPTAAALLKPAAGSPEQTMIWQDTISGVWCQARVDWLRHVVPGKRLILVDYKTAEKADAESFGRSAANYGYFIQAAFYMAGAQTIGLDEDPAFLFVVQEKQAPYLVNVIELDATAMNIGYREMRRAITTFADCQRTGTWPGFSPEVQTASLPHWFVKDHDEEPEA